VAWWLFQNLVITAVLTAAVALICRVARMGPVARHALWLVVLVKFMTPPLIVWPWAVPDPFGLATVDVRIDVRPIVDARSIAATGTMSVDRRVVASQLLEAPPVAGGIAQAGTVDPARVLFWFLWVWVTGSLCMLAIEGTRLMRLARRMAAAPPADPAIVSRVAELAARLGLRPVPVVTLTGGGSPMVWCLGRPRLLWPADLSGASSGDQLSGSMGSRVDGVIVHELAHVTRKDHLIGWLELFAGVVWWWNPLFWFVRSSLREQAELACDAWVISALPDGRRAYAEALLTLAGATGFERASRSLAVIGIRPGSRCALERRLVMIMQGRTALRLPMAGLIALGLMAAATLPAWATAQQQTPPVPPPPAAPAVKPKPSLEPAPLAPPPPPAVEIAPEPPPPPPAWPRPGPSWRTRPPTLDGQTVRTPPRVQPGFVYSWNYESELPADGQKLIESFNADSKAIREEADRKIDERRDAVMKALQTLQEQYTKAGKLDEAVAIRDYLRAGWPPRDNLFQFWRDRR
jgi:bla regulator protein blaR1